MSQNSTKTATEKKKYYSSSKLKKGENKPILYWLVISLVFIFLFLAPFHKALFIGGSLTFDVPLYYFGLGGAFLLLLASLYFFKNWSFGDKRDFYSIFIWLLPISYLISLSSAGSYQSATTLLYLHIIYVTFFLVGLKFLTKKSGSVVTQIGIIGSGYVIVLFGFMNWFGNVHYNDAIMSDYFGQRLTSVFQYANSYAAFLIGLLISALFLVSINRSRWYLVLINSFMLVPIIISMFLTLSRGGLVLLPIIILVCLTFMSFQKQILFIIHIATSVVLSLLCLSSVTKIGLDLQKNFSDSISLKGWSILLLISLVGSLLSYLVQQFISPIIEKITANINNLRYSYFLLPGVVILIGLACFYLLINVPSFTNMFPSYIKDRIVSINLHQSTLLERGTFYLDAIKIFKDYPLFGTGGGGWSALYEQYQNNPYISRQAHNFLAQYLVEGGIVGFLILFFFLITVYYSFIRNYIKSSNINRENNFIFFIIATSILIHSIIDFDMSFAYLATIVFLCLGGMVASLEIVTTTTDTRTNIKWSWLYPAVLCIVAVVVFISSTQFLKASSLYANVIKETQSSRDAGKILSTLDQALSLEPNYPTFLLMKASVLNQLYEQTKEDKYYTNAFEILDKLQKKEPHNHQMLDIKYEMYMKKNQYDKAVDIINNEIAYFQWDITVYEKAILHYLNLGNIARNQNKPTEMDKYWGKAFEIRDIINSKVQQLSLLTKDQMQGRPFNFTPTLNLYIGEISYLRKDYPSASVQLQPFAVASLDEQMNRLGARFYLAAMRKQNMDDQSLYQKLIEKDPNEQKLLNDLLNSHS